MYHAFSKVNQQGDYKKQLLLSQTTKSWEHEKSKVIVQRFKFSSLVRFGSQEKPFQHSYVCVRLRSLAEFSCFEASLDDMLRDRIVCGINDEHIQRRLLGESKLTLKKAIEMAMFYTVCVYCTIRIYSYGTTIRVWYVPYAYGIAIYTTWVYRRNNG